MAAPGYANGMATKRVGRVRTKTTTRPAAKAEKPEDRFNPRLRAFAVAVIICDATDDFCARFLRPRSDLRAQMTRAVRLCRQSVAAGAAPETAEPDVQLVRAVRAGMGAMLVAYEEFLRHDVMGQWGKNDPRTLAVRAIAKQGRGAGSGKDESALYERWLKDDDPAVVANAVLCLIHQSNYLLARPLHGHRYRYGGEDGEPSAPTEQATGPDCPICGRPMVIRTARRGVLSGSRFWGCSGFPECRKTMPCDDTD